MGLIEKQSYESFWSFSSLNIIKFSGFNKSENNFIKCNLQNYPNCDIIKVYDKGGGVNENVIHSFVALCRREYENDYPYEKCEIAQLWAGTERRWGFKYQYSIKTEVIKIRRLSFATLL